MVTEQMGFLSAKLKRNRQNKHEQKRTSVLDFNNNCHGYMHKYLSA